MLMCLNVLKEELHITVFAQNKPLSSCLFITQDSKYTHLLITNVEASSAGNHVLILFVSNCNHLSESKICISYLPQCHIHRNNTEKHD